MAKSLLEGCQARLKHQLSDDLGEKLPSLPSSCIKTLEFICTKSSLRADRPATAIPLSPRRKRQKNSRPAGAISANAALESLGLLGNRQAWLPWWAEATEQPGERAQDSSQGLTVPTKASYSATESLPVLMLEMQMGKRK